MIKVRHSLIITALIIAICMIIGIIFKSGYKDYNKEVSPIDSYYVGILTEEMTKSQVELMKDTLKDSNYILKVKCVGNMRFDYSCAMQNVIIEEVVKGDEIKKGDEIQILKCTTIFAEYEDEEKSANMGFVAEMKNNNEYLLFLDKKIHCYDEDIYKFSDDYLLQPIFAYNRIPRSYFESESMDANHIKYKKVKDAHFISDSEGAIDVLIELNNYMIEKYPLVIGENMSSRGH